MIPPVTNKVDLLTSSHNGGELESAAGARPAAARTQRDVHHAEAESLNQTESLNQAGNNQEDLDRAVRKVEDALNSSGVQVKLAVDRTTDRVVVKVMKESGEVIRQFPSEEVLKLGKYLSEGQTDRVRKGMFLEEQG